MNSNRPKKDEINQSIQERQTEFDSIMALLNEKYILEKEYRELVSKYMDENKLDELRESPRFKQLLEQINNFKQKYILNAEEMRIVVAEKKSKQQVDRQLNCEIFDKMDSPEFKKYLIELISNKDLIGQRFQIVIQSSERQGLDYHWSAADILVKDDDIEILHFDSITHSVKWYPQGGLNGEELYRILQSINSTKPIKLIDSHTQVKDKDVSLQRDHESCSILALSIALTMSKIANLHNLLDAKKEWQSSNNVKSYSIAAVNLPALLLKNAQDANVIKHYQEVRQNDDLNKILTKKGNKNIEEYTTERSHMIPSEDESIAKRPQNIGIFQKRERYKKIVTNKHQGSTAENDKAFFEVKDKICDEKGEIANASTEKDKPVISTGNQVKK